MQVPHSRLGPLDGTVPYLGGFLGILYRCKKVVDLKLLGTVLQYRNIGSSGTLKNRGINFWNSISWRAHNVSHSTLENGKVLHPSAVCTVGVIVM